MTMRLRWWGVCMTRRLRWWGILRDLGVALVGGVARTMELRWCGVCLTLRFSFGAVCALHCGCDGLGCE